MGFFKDNEEDRISAYDPTIVRMATPEQIATAQAVTAAYHQKCRNIIARALETGYGDPYEVFRTLYANYPGAIPVYPDASNWRWAHPETLDDLKYAIEKYTARWEGWYENNPAKMAEWKEHEAKFRWAMSLTIQ